LHKGLNSLTEVLTPRIKSSNVSGTSPVPGTVEAMPVLLHEYHMILIVQRDYLNAIRVFENIERRDLDPFSRSAGIGTYADPSILEDVH
jgi:hypothetical protein